MKSVCFSCIITLCVMLFSFVYSCKKKNAETYEMVFIKKTESINQNIYGKQVFNHIQILGDFICQFNHKMVLLLTVGSDCSGCRAKGYQYVTRINTILKQKIAFVVGFGLNESFERQNNGLVEIIYPDDKTLIKMN